MTRVVTDGGALKAALLPGCIVVSTRKATAGAANARSRGHVITGEMIGSVEVIPLPPVGGARVQATAKQALFEEFGTRYRPPHVWFRPSMDVAAMS